MERPMSHLTVFEHDELPAEQFEDLEQQRETSFLGMWTFLATEVLFFGVLFTAFFVYRTRWPWPSGGFLPEIITTPLRWSVCTGTSWIRCGFSSSPSSIS